MRAGMRNRFLSRLAVFAGALLAFSSGVFGSSIAERFSLRVSPMAMVTLGGHFNDTDKLSAVVDIGGGLGAGVRFELSKNAYLDAGYSYLVLPVKTGKTPYAFRHQNSYFDMSAATLNLSLYLKSGYVIEPYLTLGCGLYPWSFRTGMLGGSVWPAYSKPQNSLSDRSFGINFGLGAEVSIFLHLTAVLEFRYTYIYSRNVGKFGTDDFNQQDFLGLGVGFIYYFSRK
jgi:opacity protein-like surface antigen